MAGSSKNDPVDKDRTFVCTRTCYWNGTRYYGGREVEDAGRAPDRLTMPAKKPIPANFQWENWEQIN